MVLYFILLIACLIILAISNGIKKAADRALEKSGPEENYTPPALKDDRSALDDYRDKLFRKKFPKKWLATKISYVVCLIVLAVAIVILLTSKGNLF